MARRDRHARALRQLGSVGSEGAIRNRRTMRHGGAGAQAHRRGAAMGAALRPCPRSVVAGQGRSIRRADRRCRPPLRLRCPEYSVDPRAGASQLCRRDARQRLRRSDLHPLPRVAAQSLAARDAVQLLYVSVSIPPGNGAGIRRRALGSLGVALNLGGLCYFKYTNFIFDSLNVLTGAPLPFVNIVLPLGISFFTFQQIAYLVDVMRGARVERDIVSYTLFVSFFPHLIAGPLVHHAARMPQFKRCRSGRSAVLAARGLAIFAAGLFKKVVIADNLAQFVSPVFAHLDAGGGVTTPWAWLATLAYSLQIYFDFSGYSDMAIGLALLFGIRLPVNFRSPYQATSIIEFWRRWHITLSRFLRDYLYIPLGGNRLGEQRRYVNL